MIHVKAGIGIAGVRANALTIAMSAAAEKRDELAPRWQLREVEETYRLFDRQTSGKGVF